MDLTSRLRAGSYSTASRYRTLPPERGKISDLRFDPLEDGPRQCGDGPSGHDGSERRAGENCEEVHSGCGLGGVRDRLSQGAVWWDEAEGGYREGTGASA